MVSVSCFGVRVSVMFHFMFVHYTFSSGSFPWLSLPGSFRVTEENLVFETVQSGPYFSFECFLCC